MLPCVEIFNKFAGRAESIIMGTDRRTDLDKAYAVLIDAVFRTIERAANEHPKTPPDVIKFGRWTPFVDHMSMLITLNNFNVFNLFLQRTTRRWLVSGWHELVHYPIT